MSDLEDLNAEELLDILEGNSGEDQDVPMGAEDSDDDDPVLRAIEEAEARSAAHARAGKDGSSVTGGEMSGQRSTTPKTTGDNVPPPSASTREAARVPPPSSATQEAARVPPPSSSTRGVPPPSSSTRGVPPPSSSTRGVPPPSSSTREPGRPRPLAEAGPGDGFGQAHMAASNARLNELGSSGPSISFAVSLYSRNGAGVESMVEEFRMKMQPDCILGQLKHEIKRHSAIMINPGDHLVLSYEGEALSSYGEALRDIFPKEMWDTSVFELRVVREPPHHHEATKSSWERFAFNRKRVVGRLLLPNPYQRIQVKENIWYRRFFHKNSVRVWFSLTVLLVLVFLLLLGLRADNKLNVDWVVVFFPLMLVSLIALVIMFGAYQLMAWGRYGFAEDDRVARAKVRAAMSAKAAGRAPPHISLTPKKLHWDILFLFAIVALNALTPFLIAMKKDGVISFEYTLLLIPVWVSLWVVFVALCCGVTSQRLGRPTNVLILITLFIPTLMALMLVSLRLDGLITGLSWQHPFALLFVNLLLFMILTLAYCLDNPMSAAVLMATWILMTTFGGLLFLKTENNDHDFSYGGYVIVPLFVAAALFLCWSLVLTTDTVSGFIRPNLDVHHASSDTSMSSYDAEDEPQAQFEDATVL